MKQAVFALATLVALVFATNFSSCSHRSAIRGAALVPADTLLFVQIPDFDQTRNRWPKTALAGILNEPEVKAFLEKPLSRVKALQDLKAWRDRLDKVKAQEVLIAVTSISEKQPRAVAAIRYGGKKEDVDALLADAKAFAQQEHVDGKSDMVKRGSATIETFTTTDFTFASAHFKDWCVVGSDIHLVEETLDRLSGENKSANLSQNDRFKKSLEQVPKKPDALVFIQPQTLADRLQGVLEMSGQGQSKGFEDFRKIEAVTATVTLDGANFRDTVYLLAPSLTAPQALTDATLALTSPDTLLYFANCLDFDGIPKTASSAQSASSNPVLAGLFGALDQNLAQHNLQLSDIPLTFAPELAMFLNWNPEEMQPNLMLTIPVRDHEKAKRFLDAIESEPIGEAKWERLPDNEVGTLVLSGMKLQMVSPTLCLSDRFVLLGLNSNDCVEAVKGAARNEKPLTANPRYKAARELVGNASYATGFVDAKPLFEKIYGVARQMIMAFGMLNPNISQNIDIQKLPTTEAISKHLGPIAYSHRAVAGGQLVESAGPITVNQTVLGIGAGVGIIAVPALKQAFPAAVAGGLGNSPAAASPTSAPEGASPVPEPSATPATE